VEQRISMVTLGVDDLARARRFYTAIGWTESSDSTDDIVFFQVGGSVLGLWNRSALAEDSGVAVGDGWSGVTLAHNVRSAAEVDTVIDLARSAGAAIVRNPDATFWGGYSGVFVDPDGHPWEIAHNPGWPLAPDGSVRLPT